MPSAEPSAAALGDHDITVVRILDAPVASVWKAWTDPVHLAAWWGPRGFSCPVCRIDPRPGGIWHLDMEGPDGSVYPCRGRFMEVVEERRLVYSDEVAEGESAWGDRPPPSCVQIVTFEDLGGRTRLTVTMRMATEADRERMAALGVEGGWTSSLDKLADLLAELGR